MDTNFAAICEYNFGAGKDCKRFIYMGIGTGISCGIIIDDEVIRYSFNCSGDTGHIIVKELGRKCACGGHGCLEAYSSGWSIREMGLELISNDKSKPLKDIYDKNGDLTAKNVYEVMLEGDVEAKFIIEQSGECLGRALTTLTHMFYPEIISLGGGIGLFADRVVEVAREKVKNIASPAYFDNLRFEKRKYGMNSGFCGAAYYSMIKVRSKK